MKILVACEFSGIVRDAFKAKGHDAWSCDLLPTERPGNHYQCDVREVLYQDWDLLIGHPPCTYLANSGVRWLYEKGTKTKITDRWENMFEASRFFRLLLDAPIERICIENPIQHLYASVPKYSQIIHPYQFGHGEQKATCLWLKNLPALRSTNIVAGREQRIWKMAPGPERAKERSKTFEGIANAMADQWTQNALV